MSSRPRASQPIGKDRDFHLEAVPRPTPDLHKLTQVLLTVAINRAKSGEHTPASPNTLRNAGTAS
jgi:hypothetical protein